MIGSCLDKEGRDDEDRRRCILKENKQDSCFLGELVGSLQGYIKREPPLSFLFFSWLYPAGVWP